MAARCTRAETATMNITSMAAPMQPMTPVVKAEAKFCIAPVFVVHGIELAKWWDKPTIKIYRDNVMGINGDIMRTYWDTVGVTTNDIKYHIPIFPTAV
jgi:hypothetical protein